MENNDVSKNDVVEDVYKIETIIEIDRPSSSRTIAQELNISRRHLKRLGYTQQIQCLGATRIDINKSHGPNFYQVAMHPPYSPDLAPSDYHLFLSMANDLPCDKRGWRKSLF